APDNHALVTDPALEPGDIQTLHLRGDLTWSDGVPVTAYDVFYTYLTTLALEVEPAASRLTQNVIGARLIDDHTIAFQYKSADCTSLARTNMTIVPAHTFDRDFTTFVGEINPSDESIRSYQDWLDAYPQERWSKLWSEQSATAPAATAGEFQFNALRPEEDIRL